MNHQTHVLSGSGTNSALYLAHAVSGKETLIQC